MLTIAFSTRADNPSHIKHLQDSSGLIDVEVLQFINDGERSLTEVYNEAIGEAKYNIVVLVHDDIIFDTLNWGRKILKHFKRSPEYTILGVAGTTYMPENGRWWEEPGEMIGIVNHQHEGRKWKSQYSEDFGNQIRPAVVVDGVFMAVNRDEIKADFNPEYKGFHFYDVSFSLSNFLLGAKIGVICDVRLTHLSIGMTNEKWEENRQQFADQYRNELPVLMDRSYPAIHEKGIKRVSVIIPVYNNGKFLNRCLDSVFRQGYKNLEVILTDDASTDPFTLFKLEHIKGDSIVKIRHEQNQGVASARNSAIAASTGDYILPLDPDDWILDDYIQRCVDVLNLDKNYSPVYCDTHHVGEITGVEKRPEWSRERLLKGPFIVNCAMFSRDAFDRTDGYDSTMKGWEDYELWVQMMNAGYRGRRIGRPMFVYYHHEKEGTVSAEANKKQQELYNYIMTKNAIYGTENIPQ